MSENRTAIYGLPYGYDYPSENPDGGTVKRIDALFERLKDFKIPCTVILTADTKSKNQYPLEKQMGDYIKTRWFPVKEVLLPFCKKRSWGTLEETERAIQMIAQQESLFSHEKVLIYVSSNPGHLFGRVRLCWWLLKTPKHWEVQFVKANHSFSRKEWMQEIFMKIPVYLFKLLKKRLHT